MRKLFRDFYSDLKSSRHYLIASTLVFMIGIYAGFSSGNLQGILAQQIEEIRKLAQMLDQMNNTQLWLFVFIFFNNLLKALLFVALGGFFGLFPLYSLVMNGMILGFLAHTTQANGGDLPQMVVRGILPHGIIELPAIILAGAYGIRFGFIVARGTISWLIPAKRKAAGQQIAYFLKMTIPLMLVLIVSLFVAAIIESSFTYWLVRH
ncbi:stage II sporulation protein M [Ferviditalea candida]|uniref:Stage II sporulation protein M n=1 Tax=Ferviditalea candida TaxID=3108399 RepID=A0ABU5ZM02_9BACL|nr:stage II sporulation protein M [Paenibacillaceae bacterium T2]